MAGSGTSAGEDAEPLTSIGLVPSPRIVNSTNASTPEPDGKGGTPPNAPCTPKRRPVWAKVFGSRSMNPGFRTLNGAPLAKKSPSVTGPVRNAQYASPLNGSQPVLICTSLAS